jgi:hypothetical protein
MPRKKKSKANGDRVQAEGQGTLGEDFGTVKTDPGEFMAVEQVRSFRRGVVVFSPDGTEAAAVELAQARFDGIPPGDDPSPFEVELYMEHRPKWTQKGPLGIKIAAAKDKQIDRAQQLEAQRMEAIRVDREGPEAEAKA